jgi:fatty acid amide hydrolase 2
MLGLGPIVKSVRDAALLYSIVQPDFAPPASWDPPPDARALSFGSFGKVRCSADTEHILAQAQDALRRAGLDLKQGAPDFMEHVSLAWQLAMAEGKGQGICELAYPDNPRGFWLDWLKYKLGLKALNHRYLSWAAIGVNLFAPNDKQVQWLREVRRTGLEKLEELLEGRGVLLTPVYPTPAKAHGRVYKEIFSARKTFDRVLPFIALANLLGLPALVVPCGRSARGLPIGLQVTAALGSEELIFQVGAVLEKALGGWRRCTDHD